MKTETKKLTKKFWMIVLAAVCAGALFMLSGVEAKANGEIEVDSWVGLQRAIDDFAPAGTETTIKLTADIVPETPTAADAYINIGFGKKIVLDLNGHIMNRNLSSAQENGMVIKVEGELTLNDSNPTASHDGVTFDNPVTWESNTVTVTGGAITGGKNSTHDGINSCYGGGVNVCAGAKFTMNAGTIVACEGNDGGGVYADGEKHGINYEVIAAPAEFVMNGGRITACVAEDGGGVCNYGYSFNSVNYGACFTLNGGVIEYCEAKGDNNSGGAGGGVYSCGLVIIHGGNIKNCKAKEGGGVECCGESDFPLNAFIMTGGTISDCEAIDWGGGIWALNVLFVISGGEIRNCKAYIYGGGVYFRGNADFSATLSGGKINECKAPDGGGVYVFYGEFNMTGGEISKCEAYIGGGVYVTDGEFNMTGGEISECEAAVVEECTLTTEAASLPEELSRNVQPHKTAGESTLTETDCFSSPVGII